MRNRYALRDDQWERMRDLLPGRAGHVGSTATENRRFGDAVLYRYRAGLPWRDLPARFGDCREMHTRPMRWSKSGVWEQGCKYLAADADTAYAMIDATIIRAHHHAAGAKGGTTRQHASAAPAGEGGVSTKLHATCDALGNPTSLPRTPGHASARAGANALLPEVVNRCQARLADSASDAHERVLAVLEQAAGTSMIPPKAHRRQARSSDKPLSQARPLLEHCFATRKQYRALATRSDKRAASFLGALYLAASVIFLH